MNTNENGNSNANFLNHVEDQDGNVRLMARYPETLDDETSGLIIVNPENGKAAAFGYKKSRAANPDFEFTPTEKLIANGEFEANETKTSDEHPDYYLKVGRKSYVVWKLDNGGYSFRPRKATVRKANFSFSI